MRNSSIPSTWDLFDNPFTEMAPPISHASFLAKVFTGREDQMKKAKFLLSGDMKRNILVYGEFGIGKTAFTYELLRQLGVENRKFIFCPIAFPKEMENIAPCALISLALAMPNDQWSQNFLQNVGIRPDRYVVEKTSTLKAGFTEFSERTLHSQNIDNPSLSFSKLVERALEDNDKVIIFIDDLDKRDPNFVATMLSESQGILKGEACFIISGHELCVSDTIRLRPLGLFDEQLYLDPIKENVICEMILNYLNAVRNRPRNFQDQETAYLPFTYEAIKRIAMLSRGIPRYVNRICGKVLTEAMYESLELIDLEKTIQILTSHASYLKGMASVQEQRILSILIERNYISEENITLR